MEGYVDGTALYGLSLSSHVRKAHSTGSFVISMYCNKIWAFNLADKTTTTTAF